MAPGSGRLRYARAMSFLAVLLVAACPAGAESDWAVVAAPAPQGSLAPRIAVADDAAVLSWLEPAPGGGFALRGARVADGTATALSSAAATGTDLFVNWADTPGIVPSPDGSLVAHWLQKLGDGPYAYGIELARSTDGGASWTRLGRLHDDARPVEHGFASFAPGATGLTAVWLDGRGTGGGHGAGGPMTLRTAHVSDGVRQEVELDPSVCDCCPTAIAATPTGPLVAYRDRVVGDELRDIAVVRWLGDRWSDPTLLGPDGWAVAGCPVNGPDVAVHGERVAVAWFTMEPSTRVNVALSTDGGATFGAPVAALASDAGADVHGRPAIAYDATGTLHLVQLVESERRGRLVHQSCDAQGAWSRPVEVLATTVARRSGMPVLRRVGDELLLATTAVDADGGTRVELRRLAPE